MSGGNAHRRAYYHSMEYDCIITCNVCQCVILFFTRLWPRFFAPFSCPSHPRSTSNFSLPGCPGWQCVPGAVYIVTALRRSVSLLLFKFQVIALLACECRGGSLTLPPEKRFEFTSVFGEYDTLPCAGGSLTRPYNKNLKRSDKYQFDYNAKRAPLLGSAFLYTICNYSAE